MSNKLMQLSVSFSNENDTQNHLILLHDDYNKELFDLGFRNLVPEYYPTLKESVVWVDFSAWYKDLHYRELNLTRVFDIPKDFLFQEICVECPEPKTCDFIEECSPESTYHEHIKLTQDFPDKPLEIIYPKASRWAWQPDGSLESVRL